MEGHTKGEAYGKQFKSHEENRVTVEYRVKYAFTAHLPCNHLLLFIGGVPSTAQYFGRSGEEVQAVVLEVLIYQWQENLLKKT